MKKVFTHLLILKKSVGFLPLLCGTCLFLTSFLIHTSQEVVSVTETDALTGSWPSHPGCLASR